MKQRTIEVLGTRIYRGANYWIPVPAILCLLDMGELRHRMSNTTPDFCEKLLLAVPTLADHPCCAEASGGFVQQLCYGMDLVHAGEHLALELQTLAGQSVSYGKSHASSDPERAERAQTARLVFECQDAEVGLAAGRLAVRLLNSLVDQERDQDFNFGSEIAGLVQLAKDLRPGIDTRKLKEEAESRGIPVVYLDQKPEECMVGGRSSRRLSLMQLGQGKFQKRIWAPYVSSDSFIAAQIASNKELTSNLLRNSGLPTPRSISVTDEESAAAAARQIGYPVVVKPLDGSQGRGVGVYLQTAREVRAHFPLALAQTRSGTVLVEEFIVGRHYRLLTVGGRFVAAAERLPAQVTGDGLLRVRQLVELSNADPSRPAKHKTRIVLNDYAIALARSQGYSPDDIPPLGKVVQLARTCNISTGGTSIDRTAESHPYNIMIAEQAAQVIGLDIAGIDLIAPDITQPVLETGGAICEVNGGPGLYVVHTQPVEGQPRDVTHTVIDFLFPPGAPSRVPIVAVTGTDSAAATQIIAHILRVAGCLVGSATRDGIDINGARIFRGDMTGPDSARAVLQNPTIDTAVLEISREGILCSGLGYDHADVTVITKVGSEATTTPNLEGPHDPVRLSALVAGSTRSGGKSILDADDPESARIASETHAEIIYFSHRPDNKLIASHVRAGGRAVLACWLPNGETLSLVADAQTTVLCLQDIPAVSQDCGSVQISSILAATAACIALEIKPDAISRGLQTFLKG